MLSYRNWTVTWWDEGLLLNGGCWQAAHPVYGRRVMVSAYKLSSLCYAVDRAEAHRASIKATKQRAFGAA